MSDAEIIWDLGSLPFHVGALSRPRDDRFPQRLPFRVGYRRELGLVTQVFDAGTMEVLRDVYARGSQLGIPMGDQGLGKAYAQDFQGVVERWLGGEVASTSLLEIGCGSGHLLIALADAGARVTGVEPDPRCKATMEERGIRVASCAFEDFHTDETFDCVLHYCVLEHVVDPVAFLRDQRDLLRPGGRIICAVPDCGAAFHDGDISIFIHQHWSYFSMASLGRLAAAAGLRVEADARAQVGALLYVSLSAAPDGDAGSADGAAVVEDPLDFVARARRGRDRLDSWVEELHAQGRTLGIYCPTRAINYVSEGDSGWLSARLFDDAPLLRGKYVPPFTAPIEDGSGLEREGLDELLIMSRPFGAAIAAAVHERDVEPEPRIHQIGELLSHG